MIDHVEQALNVVAHFRERHNAEPTLLARVDVIKQLKDSGQFPGIEFDTAPYEEGQITGLWFDGACNTYMVESMQT